MSKKKPQKPKIPKPAHTWIPPEVSHLTQLENRAYDLVDFYGARGLYMSNKTTADKLTCNERSARRTRNKLIDKGVFVGIWVNPLTVHVWAKYNIGVRKTPYLNHRKKWYIVNPCYDPKLTKKDRGLPPKNMTKCQPLREIREDKMSSKVEKGRTKCPPKGGGREDKMSSKVLLSSLEEDRGCTTKVESAYNPPLSKKSRDAVPNPANSSGLNSNQRFKGADEAQKPELKTPIPSDTNQTDEPDKMKANLLKMEKDFFYKQWYQKFTDQGLSEESARNLTNRKVEEKYGKPKSQS